VRYDTQPLGDLPVCCSTRGHSGDLLSRPGEGTDPSPSAAMVARWEINLPRRMARWTVTSKVAFGRAGRRQHSEHALESAGFEWSNR